MVRSDHITRYSEDYEAFTDSKKYKEKKRSLNVKRLLSKEKISEGSHKVSLAFYWLRSSIVKLCVDPILSHQLFMSSTLCDLVVVNNGNHIRILNRG